MKESSLLKPRPPKVSTNDWPSYVLSDATIYRSDGKTLANPLLVQLEGSLVVRGCAEVDDANLFSNRKQKPRLLYSLGDTVLTRSCIKWFGRT